MEVRVEMLTNAMRRTMARNDEGVTMKKSWKKPELKRMIAGAAEQGPQNNRPDSANNVNSRS